MKHRRHKGPPAPFDAPSLERLAIAYVGRYATTRAKLQRYLERKVKERGWDGDPEPSLIGALVARVAGLGFVDDEAFALARAASFRRKGLGERRLHEALRAAGVGEDSSAEARAAARDAAWASARRFAERKRIGPFAEIAPDAVLRRKQFAMMMRAGHPAEISRVLVGAAPGEIPEEDNV